MAGATGTMHMPLFLVLALSSILQTEAASGKMTMWSLKEDVIIGSNIPHEGGPSACKFADPGNGGLNSPAAISPYIKQHRYCAADINTVFANGNACGSCYKLSFDGIGGTDGGRAGSEVIQVINSGTMNHGAAFDCQIHSFEQITGAKTGVYPITYEEVPCEVSSGGAVAMVLEGDNAHHTKMVFANMFHPASSVTLVAGGKEFPLTMEACCGTWKGDLNGHTGKVDFKLAHSDGAISTFSNCFSDWPVKKSSVCREYSTSGEAGDNKLTSVTPGTINNLSTIAASPPTTVYSSLVIAGMDYGLLQARSAERELVVDTIRAGVAFGQSSNESAVGVVLTSGSTIALLVIQVPADTTALALMQDLTTDGPAIANRVLLSLRRVAGINSVLTGVLNVHFGGTSTDMAALLASIPKVAAPVAVAAPVGVAAPVAVFPAVAPAPHASMPFDLNAATVRDIKSSIKSAHDQWSAFFTISLVGLVASVAGVSYALSKSKPRTIVDEEVVLVESVEE